MKPVRISSNSSLSAMNSSVPLSRSYSDHGLNAAVWHEERDVRVPTPLHLVGHGDPVPGVAGGLVEAVDDGLGDGGVGRATAADEEAVAVLSHAHLKCGKMFKRVSDFSMAFLIAFMGPFSLVFSGRCTAR